MHCLATYVPVLEEQDPFVSFRERANAGQGLRWCKAGVQNVDIKRDVHRVVPNNIPDTFHDALVADLLDIFGIGDVEADVRIVLLVVEGM